MRRTFHARDQCFIFLWTIKAGRYKYKIYISSRSGVLMTVTIELRPEIAESLAALAAEQGVSVEQYLRRLVEAQVSGLGQTTLSPGERAAAWRDSVKDLPHTPPLSDEAISRESIYEARG
jgi:hypothetical protein